VNSVDFVTAQTVDQRVADNPAAMGQWLDAKPNQADVRLREK
jgi:hypothetical protein